jgi:hypothetical protein
MLSWYDVPGCGVLWPDVARDVVWLSSCGVQFEGAGGVQALAAMRTAGDTAAVMEGTRTGRAPEDNQLAVRGVLCATPPPRLPWLCTSTMLAPPLQPRAHPHAHHPSARLCPTAFATTLLVCVLLGVGVGGGIISTIVVVLEAQ